VAFEIALINPRSIRRRKAGKKKGAKIMAKRRKGRKARKSPVRRRKVARVAAAPRRRRRKAAGKRRPALGYVVGTKRRRRKLNPRRASRRRRHSNPRFSINGITSQLMPAAYGAAGALVLDVALGYIPLPAMLKTGYARHATRIVGALGVGFLASKFLRGRAAAIGQGALTVAVYGLLKDVAAQTLGDKVRGLGDYEEITVDGYMDAAPGMGAYLGAYMPGEGVGDYATESMGDMNY
jgi:hypothetical protein